MENQEKQTQTNEIAVDTVKEYDDIVARINPGVLQISSAIRNINLDSDDIKEYLTLDDIKSMHDKIKEKEDELIELFIKDDNITLEQKLLIFKIIDGVIAFQFNMIVEGNKIKETIEALKEFVEIMSKFNFKDIKDRLVNIAKVTDENIYSKEEINTVVTELYTDLLKSVVENTSVKITKFLDNNADTINKKVNEITEQYKDNENEASKPLYNFIKDFLLENFDEYQDIKDKIHKIYKFEYDLESVYTDIVERRYPKDQMVQKHIDDAINSYKEFISDHISEIKDMFKPFIEQDVLDKVYEDFLMDFIVASIITGTHEKSFIVFRQAMMCGVPVKEPNDMGIEEPDIDIENDPQMKAMLDMMEYLFGDKDQLEKMLNNPTWGRNKIKSKLKNKLGHTPSEAEVDQIWQMVVMFGSMMSGEVDPMSMLGNLGLDEESLKEIIPEENTEENSDGEDKPTIH